MKQPLTPGAVMVVALATLQGCAASLTPSSSTADAGQATAGLALPKVENIIPKGETIVGTPTELYTRIARGALTCWFGATGPLKGEYIYHADAAPASQGGRSEISVHVRDKTKISQSEQKALRVYRVIIAPGESKPTVEAENLKLPDPLAGRLTADVKRWAADEEGCSEAPAAANWTADNAPQEEKKATAKSKQKASTQKKAPPKASAATKSK